MNKVSIGHPSSHYQHKPTIWTSYQLPGVFIWYCTIFHDIPMDSHLSSINYLQLSSNIINYHLSSLIYHHLLYIICHLPSTIIYRPSSIVYHLTSIIDPLSYIIYHLSSIINHLSSIINHHSSFISHHHHHHHHHHLLIRWAWNCCTSAAGWPSSLAPRVDGSGTIRHLLVWSSLPSLRPWYASDTQTHTLTAWHAKWGPCAIGPTLKRLSRSGGRTSAMWGRVLCLNGTTNAASQPVSRGTLPLHVVRFEGSGCVLGLPLGNLLGF